MLKFSALRGLWRYFHTAGELTQAMQLARRTHSAAQEQNDPALLIAGYHSLACTVFYLGDFETTRQYAKLAVQIWSSSGDAFLAEEVDSPVVSCLFHKSLSEWHLGETSSCHLTMEEAISLAKELNDMPALTAAIFNSAVLSHCERNVSKAERLASDVMELSTRYNFAFWLAIGSIMLGWAHSASGRGVKGILSIEEGIQDYLATGSMLGMPAFLGLKAEALYLGHRTFEALDAIAEAEALAERSGVRYWLAELHRLHGVFLTAIGAEETKIEASFCAGIRIAKEQKSISLEKRAQATYAEYHRQKTSGSGGRGFRLPL
jgi:hypothetical protein